MYPDNNTSHHMTNAVFGRLVGKHDHTNKKRMITPTQATLIDCQSSEIGRAKKSSAEQAAAAPTINIVRTGLPGLDVGEDPRRVGLSPGRRLPITSPPLNHVLPLSAIVQYVVSENTLALLLAHQKNHTPQLVSLA